MSDHSDKAAKNDESDRPSVIDLDAEPWNENWLRILAQRKQQKKRKPKPPKPPKHPQQTEGDTDNG